MKPVADAAHRAGMRFLLWFEPERVMPGTWLFEHHPGWLLKPGDSVPAPPRYQVNDGFHLFDLGNPEALAWLKAKLSGVTVIGIDLDPTISTCIPSTTGGMPSRGTGRGCGRSAM